MTPRAEAAENGRPSHGGRGLKLPLRHFPQLGGWSPLSRGARIETLMRRLKINGTRVAPLTGGAD